MTAETPTDFKKASDFAERLKKHLVPYNTIEFTKLLINIAHINWTIPKHITVSINTTMRLTSLFVLITVAFSSMSIALPTEASAYIPRAPACSLTYQVIAADGCGDTEDKADNAVLPRCIF